MERLLSVVRETDGIFFNEALRRDVRKKGESDFVTRADLEVSAYLCRRLREEYPEVGFLSEEEVRPDEPFAPDLSHPLWILDPIDGTTNFMRGQPGCAVSLGLWADGALEAGVIYLPYAGELFWAQRGCGAFRNGERIFCTPTTELRDCLGLLEFNAYFKADSDGALSHAEKIFTGCMDLRTLGSAALEMAYLACGRADVFLGRYLKPWDWAAGAVLVREAGGCVGGLTGDADVGLRNQHVVAAGTPEAFGALVGLLNGEKGDR
jgi:myo-inositol-1(or 4)-monophosphatase